MKTINVGLIGFGTVGSGLAEVLLSQQERLVQRSGLTVRLAKVADIMISELPPQFAGTELTSDAAELINDPDIDIVVELIGGIQPAKTFVMDAIAAGKHVVTANKALLSQEGKDIFAAAAAKGVEVGFEASVGGGIPVIKALKEGLVANNILAIMGNIHAIGHGHEDGQLMGRIDPLYIIGGIGLGKPQFLGVLENIGKTDSLVGHPGKNIIGRTVHNTHDEIVTEGISQIEPVDIEFAREFGCRIKLLAISRNHGDHVEARVHPTMVPESHLLASINGAYNAIHFTGDTVGNVLLYGPGAGKMPTGSAVAADVVDIARDIAAGSVGRVPSLSYLPGEIKDIRITPMEELFCPWYFRISAKDEPGVLAAIAGILSTYGISIESVIQKGRQQSGPVSIVITTHTAQESSVRDALAEIDRLDVVSAPTVKIRMLAETASFSD